MSDQHTVDQVVAVARKIAKLDFRTTISRYTTGNLPGPWLITVGESSWQRHLVVDQVRGDGEEAKLSLLSERQSGCRIVSIDLTDIERPMTLGALISPGSYRGVKMLLGQGAVV